jgi:hypothetical protein
MNIQRSFWLSLVVACGMLGAVQAQQSQGKAQKAQPAKPASLIYLVQEMSLRSKSSARISARNLMT